MKSTERRGGGPAGRRPAIVLWIVALAAAILVLSLLALEGRGPSRPAGVPPSETTRSTKRDSGLAPSSGRSEGVATGADLGPPGGGGSEPPEPLHRTCRIEVEIVGSPGRDAGETLVVASRWRGHAAAGAETLARISIPRGVDSGQLELPPGDYTVQASSSASVSEPVRATLTAESRGLRLQLTMVACAALRGSVSSASGDPVQDLPVHVLDGDQVLGSTSSSITGGFELPCLPPGTWRVLAGPLRGPLLALDQVAVEEQAQPIHLVLPALGGIEVIALDAHGAVVPDLELEAVGPEGRRMELRTDFEGRASSRLVLPGLWRVFGEAGRLGRGNAALEVEAGGTGRVELILRPVR